MGLIEWIALLLREFAWQIRYLPSPPIVIHILQYYAKRNKNERSRIYLKIERINRNAAKSVAQQWHFNDLCSLAACWLFIS